MSVESGRAKASTADFLRAVRQAECDCERGVARGGAGSWQARAEFVGRRFRDRWAKTENVKVDVKVKVRGARSSLLAKLEQLAGGEGDPELGESARGRHAQE